MSLKIIKELRDVEMLLDHNKVCWVDKHLVIDLKQKAQILSESITRLEEVNKEEAILAAQEFLTEVKSVIQELNKQQIGA